ncbi:hypothetical protein [Methanospirillum lacunae]|uniref:Uncharacterized protein n=1 Tax=Methanospirillum lacunae TaxID=668570 RepID=A0A2V2N5W0_9EURY|nr:hypothetical protein [Methanospirillum lacunae]PWR70901.1 hypothetical protein DK846_12990 [Methanospirillum lacunae]
MMVWNTYQIRGMIILLTLLTVSILPAIADNEYLDGGYMGIPADIYSRMDPSVSNNIIGTVQERPLFGLSDDRPIQFGHRFVPEYHLQQGNRYQVFNETRYRPVFFHF